MRINNQSAAFGELIFYRRRFEESVLPTRTGLVARRGFVYVAFVIGAVSVGEGSIRCTPISPWKRRRKPCEYAK